ncbi:DUF1697 domain-containing protein [Nocardia sp. CDC159]|uniref:DUF1697 domain-containing protein n=1 Tax=Nocardia pulmonis TaxID=2951408 RepID=A0A9X2EA85_9NOCA|nr:MULTISPECIES: DUF1697 domain-containing protein [Nocardia]MCM6776495.1 DUF1697 domain-containing protein [Nocardia pulmonis]MCM6788919.1 DUF1697 domain-containing protein [Nocardia sp. CDC159]
MTRYAAWLRGIMPSNPNMRNEKLRGVFEGLGFELVGSLLSSGNIVFGSDETDVPALEARIQRALNAELGIPGGTIIRSRDELRALVDSDPFPGLTHGRETYLVATFVKGADVPDDPGPLPAELAGTVRIVRYDKPSRAILAVVDNTSPATPNHMTWMEKVYGKDNVTTRTWLTVQKVLAKL